MAGFKLLCAVLLIVVGQLSLGSVRVKRQFTWDQADRVNIEDYLGNKRSVKLTLDCVVYDKPCDIIGSFLKANVLLFLKTECKTEEFCNEFRKKRIEKIALHVQENYPQEWRDAIDKYLVQPLGLTTTPVTP